MMRRSSRFVLPAVLAMAVVPLFAQQAQQPPPPPPEQQVPVFRSGTDVVPISVRVVDQKGIPVTDLTQQDFRVFEDDRLRQIIGFYPQTMAPGPVVPPAVVWDWRNENRLAAATRRTFVIVLGASRMLDPDKAFDAAITFVTEKLLPQDAVSLIAFHRATPFTTDHAAVAQVIARFKKEQQELIFEVRNYYARSRVPYAIRKPFDVELDLGLPPGTPDLPAKMLDQIDRLLFEGVFPKSSLFSVADMLLGMDLAPESVRPDPADRGPADRRPYQQQYKFEEMLEGLKRRGASLQDAAMQSSPLKLFAGIEHLRFMDGEKHLVFFGGTPIIARDADIADVFAARANDARVIVDYMWTSTQCLPCRDLVDATGGFYSTVDTAAEALAKLDQRTRSSYLIGYEPSNPEMDDRYRRVRVEVNRSDVTVLYRDGYYASEEMAPGDLKEKVAATRTVTALASDSNAKGIGLQAAVVMEPGSGGSQTVRVDLVVDMASVVFAEDGASRVGELHVSVYCGDAKEKVIGEWQGRWTLRAGERLLADWRRDGMDRSVRVSAKEKPKYVKVVIYDPGSDRTGSISVKLK